MDSKEVDIPVKSGGLYQGNDTWGADKGTDWNIDNIPSPLSIRDEPYARLAYFVAGSVGQMADSVLRAVACLVERHKWASLLASMYLYGMYAFPKVEKLPSVQDTIEYLLQNPLDLNRFRILTVVLSSEITTFVNMGIHRGLAVLSSNLEEADLLFMKWISAPPEVQGRIMTASVLLGILGIETALRLVSKGGKRLAKAGVRLMEVGAFEILKRKN